MNDMESNGGSVGKSMRAFASAIHNASLSLGRFAQASNALRGATHIGTHPLRNRALLTEVALCMDVLVHNHADPHRFEVAVDEYLAAGGDANSLDINHLLKIVQDVKRLDVPVRDYLTTAISVMPHVHKHSHKLLRVLAHDRTFERVKIELGRDVGHERRLRRGAFYANTINTADVHTYRTFADSLQIAHALTARVIARIPDARDHERAYASATTALRHSIHPGVLCMCMRFARKWHTLVDMPCSLETAKQFYFTWFSEMQAAKRSGGMFKAEAFGLLLHDDVSSRLQNFARAAASTSHGVYDDDGIEPERNPVL